MYYLALAAFIFFAYAFGVAWFISGQMGFAALFVLHASFVFGLAGVITRLLWLGSRAYDKSHD